MALVLPASEAGAATVTVECRGTRGCTHQVVVYRAGAGEANDVRIDPLEDRRVRILDAAAVLTAGSACEAIDEHEAMCSAAGGFEAALGDGDDRLALSDATTLFSGHVEAGTGNDHVSARGTLNGGGGRDTLIGGRTDDTLIDGDSARNPDSDVLDGGSGIDTVSYLERRRSVTVDLAGGGFTGERGERDVVRDVESALGGSGDDRLTGRLPRADVARRGVHLNGGSGNDALVGTAADDTLTGGPGSDRIDARAGADDIDAADAYGPLAAADVIRCGAGSDVVNDPEAGDFVAASCERPWFFGPFLYSWLHASGGAGPVFGTRADCGSGRPCRYLLRMTARGSRTRGAPPAGTVLARHSVVVRRGRERRVALRLLPSGRRALRRARVLPVLLEVRWSHSGGRGRSALRTELRAGR